MDAASIVARRSGLDVRSDPLAPPDVFSNPFDKTGAVALSIVVPTINEAANLPQLVERVDAALGGCAYEVIVVDDASTDDTQDVCARLSDRYPLRLLRRAVPVAGLGGAVLEGFRQARGEFLIVMDADLQHPPERIPALVAPLPSGDADFVLGSRYVAGGSTQRTWSVRRG